MHKKSGNILVIFLSIIALVSVIAAIYFFSQNQQKNIIEPTITPTPVVDDTKNWKTFTNDKFSFKYPEKLSLVNEKTVTLTHSIPYKNSGGCDMSGLSNKQYDNLTDFNVGFEVKEAKVVPSYNNGKYSVGSLNGVWQWNSVEGCGDETYYFDLPGEKTLIVKKEVVQAFTGISTMWNLDEILKIPGVINQDESKHLFNQILGTFRFLETSKQTSSVKLLSTNGWKLAENGVFSLRYPASTYRAQIYEDSIQIIPVGNSGNDLTGSPSIISMKGYSGGSRRQFYLDAFSFYASEIVFTEKMLGNVSVLEAKIKNSNQTDLLVAKGNIFIDVLANGSDYQFVQTLVSTIIIK